MEPEDFDLFGDPVRLPNGKRGRPKHVPTQKKRNKVIMLLALGWNNERIANAIHCSLPTLRRYYFSELKRRLIQRDRLDAWQMELLADQMKEGSVSAHRLFRQMIDKNDMMLADDRFKSDAAEKSPEETIGVKEKARRAAEEASEESEWGDLINPGGYKQ